MSENTFRPVDPFPELALGCMSFPERFSDVEKIIHAAFDLGIRFLDTADLYRDHR